MKVQRGRQQGVGWVDDLSVRCLMLLMPSLCGCAKLSMKSGNLSKFAEGEDFANFDSRRLRWARYSRVKRVKRKAIGKRKVERRRS